EVRVRVPEPVVDRRSLESLDRRPVAALDLAPELVRLREEVVRVDREDTRVRLEREDHVEQHRFLLQEGAREHDAAGTLDEPELDYPLRGPRLDVSRQLQ